MITDIHTHTPRPDAIAVVDDPSELPHGCLGSIAIHPWKTDFADMESILEHISVKASDPRIVAIGETGLDALRGATMEKQQNIMARHIALSESLCKPLIIHSVRTHHLIAAMHRRYRPCQPWIVHGFRGNPATARMLTDRGIFISFGERFNPLTPASVSPSLIMLETDMSTLSISQIADKVAIAIPGMTSCQLLDISAVNISRTVLR